MRVSIERQEARVRVSNLCVAIETALDEECKRENYKKVTFAEIQLALAQTSNNYAEKMFQLETAKSMKRANKNE